MFGAQHWHTNEVWTNWHSQVRTQNLDYMVSPSDWTLSHVPDLRDIRDDCPFTRVGTASHTLAMYGCPFTGWTYLLGKGWDICLGVCVSWYWVFSARLDRSREVKLLFGPPSNSHPCVCPCNVSVHPETRSLLQQTPLRHDLQKDWFSSHRWRN